MGKRELVIALAFVLVGVVAYRFTAPPPKPSDRGLSFSRFWNNARRGIRGNFAQASFTRQGAVPVPTQTTELRIESQGNTGRLRLVGEPRTDLSYDLSVDSTGPDQETALGYAKQVAVKTDDLGHSLTLRLVYPREGRQTAAMVLRVPARLAVMVAGGSGVDVSNVAAVHLDNAAGDCAISGVTGAVSGAHRNGSLKVSGAGSVKLTLQRSRANLERVDRGATLDVRDGECRIRETKGPIDLDETRAEITIIDPAGPVRVGGADGRIALTNPRAESKIDVRRAEVEVQLSQSVPLTLLTTDDTMRLLLDGPPHVAIDAVANLGRVQATDFDLTPESVEQESRLAYTFGSSGAPRVSLRNLRGDIVLKNFRRTIVNPQRK